MAEAANAAYLTAEVEPVLCQLFKVVLSAKPSDPVIDVLDHAYQVPMMIETLGQLILGDDQGEELKRLQQERERLRLEVSMRCLTSIDRRIRAQVNKS